MEKKTAPARLLRTPEIEQTFQQAERLLFAQKKEEADRAYQDFIKTTPYNYFTPKAHYRLGELRLFREEWGEAIPHYRDSLKRGIFPEWGTRAIYQLAICYYRQGNFHDAFQTLDRLPSDAEGELRLKAGSLRVKAARRYKDPFEEIKGHIELVDGYASLPESDWEIGELTWVIDQPQAVRAVRDWVEGKGSDPREVRRLERRFKGRDAGGYVLWKLAKGAYEKGDYPSAASYAQSYADQYPKHEYFRAAQRLLAELGKRETGVHAKVGVFLPLSGKYAVYGESVLHGIECATGIYAPCRSETEVLIEVRDTGGDPKKAIQIANELAIDPEVVALIGPMSQGESDDVAPVVEASQIPTIALSQKSDLPKKGDYLFRNFLTVADQVATVVDYACAQKGLKKLAIIYAKNPVGEEYLKRFEEEVEGCGGTLIGKEGYSPDTDNLLSPLRTLKHTRESDSVDATTAPFDLLFFPDTFRRVPDLIASLKFLKLTDFALVGGAGWNHPDLAQVSTDGFTEVTFVDGFFPESSELMTRDFVTSFQAAYGVEPTLLEAYGYDTMRLLADILRRRPEISRADLQNELAATKNFPGVTGNISFDRTGDARRKLFLLTVKEGAIQEIPSH
ncbi:MAG: penicillin-binding protein activator [Deltaproteobacteria bacterium]|nr:penicillin-binding protein activator [Deltaproteobacteria bacterium]